MGICFSYGLSSGTATDSICPKGWRLPRYSGDGSYYELVQKYANHGGIGVWNGPYDRQYDTIMLLAPLVSIHSGYYEHAPGELASRTDIGLYWLNRYYSIIESNRLENGNRHISPQTGYRRGRGQSIRCLAR